MNSVVAPVLLKSTQDWWQTSLAERCRLRQATLHGETQNSIYYLLNSHRGAINHDSIIGWAQRRYCALHIAFITSADIFKKGGQANTLPLIYQLLIPSFSARLGSGRQVDLHWGCRKDDRSHVSTIRYQTWQAGKVTLAL